MSSHFGPARLIVNPRAGNGVVGKTLPRLQAALDGRGFDYDVVQTRAPGDATRFAREALDAGLRYLVAVGGDGTVLEVVNGFVEGDQAVAEDAVLGVAGAGSGCDFIRTFGLDRDPETTARHLTSDHVMPIDLGVATYVDPDGAPGRRLFANVAEVGYGAEVVRRAARLPRRLGRVRYLLAIYATLATMDRQVATVTTTQGDLTVPVVELVVANGQFFGGGMKVAPRALPDDGRYNVQIFTGQRSQVFLMTQGIYRGEHLPHPDIREFQSATVSLAPDRPMLVEADGEVLGTTPASFSLLERVVRLKI